MKKIFGGFPPFFNFANCPKLVAKKPWFSCNNFDSGCGNLSAALRILHESIFRHSPSFTAIAEKKGWIVSKANKTGQFSIITTTPDVRTFHNYPTTLRVPLPPIITHKTHPRFAGPDGGEYGCFSNPTLAAGSARQCETLVEPGAGIPPQSGPTKLQNFVGGAWGGGPS